MDTALILEYASKVKYSAMDDGQMIFRVTHKGRKILSDSVAGCVAKMLSIDTFENVKYILSGE